MNELIEIFQPAEQILQKQEVRTTSDNGGDKRGGVNDICEWSEEGLGEERKEKG